MFFRRHPPLPCRASPPQGGRSIGGDRRALPLLSPLVGEMSRTDRGGYAFAVGARHRPQPVLPPCGGDARQGRGGYPLRGAVPCP
ncbi:hypothetical protein EUU22_23775 [Ciceribacter ferrooxidans]|uniref:Uncharacterized protein n=1 Tax=Ciceribacter ferrooxidans TaxID=2509717 RepID=A0A4Q2S978_9HYPH|nr:hypothetical protein EUU22_23775 [Ciceribacter ferrooxidans]